MSYKMTFKSPKDEIMALTKSFNDNPAQLRIYTHYGSNLKKNRTFDQLREQGWRISERIRLILEEFKEFSEEYELEKAKLIRILSRWNRDLESFERM